MILIFFENLFLTAEIMIEKHNQCITQLHIKNEKFLPATRPTLLYVFGVAESESEVHSTQQVRIFHDLKNDLNSTITIKSLIP